jgi:hypothetical protein
MTTSMSALRISSAFLAIASMGAISSSCQSYRRVIAVRELSGFFADLVAATARADYPLAVQVARMRGLVKGYGDTHARGDAKFGTPAALIPRMRGRSDAATTLNALIKAALADEDGQALDKAIAGLDAGASGRDARS